MGNDWKPVISNADMEFLNGVLSDDGINDERTNIRGTLTSGTFKASDISVYAIRQPVSIEWNPQPDITTYELAKLMPLFVAPRMLMPEDVPDGPERRHLIVHDPNTQ